MGCSQTDSRRLLSIALGEAAPSPEGNQCEPVCQIVGVVREKLIILIIFHDFKHFGLRSVKAAAR